MLRFAAELSLGALALALTASPPHARADGVSCDAAVVEYTLAGSLKITDTVMGAGDGVHAVGPGKVVLRFETRGGVGDVKLLSYELVQSFTVESKALFWTTRVTTNSETLAEPSKGNAAVTEGALRDHTIYWSSHPSPMRSVGTVRCEGSMCGKFGAPPPGESQLRVPPQQVDLMPFVFSPDMKTFRMSFALFSETEAPKQKTFVALAARETRRACAN